MPLPKPRKGEKEQRFVSRCMAHESAKEFKDIKQRFAVCMSQFRKGPETKEQMERITEYTDSRGVSLSVDADNGIVRNVKVLGCESKNGRRYKREALEAARNKYESAKINIDHPRKPGEARSYTERFGRLSNIRVTDEGIFGDLHYNPRHALAPQFEWDARNAPENVGLSHVVNATAVRKNGTTEIESIEDVISVDVVADPATNQSLYESTDVVREDGKMAKTSGITVEEIKAAGLWDILKQEVLEEHKNDAEITQLREDNNRLKKEVEELKAVATIARRKQAIQEKLKEVALPEAAVTELFLEQCLNAKDDETLEALLQDRLALVDKKKVKAKEQRTADGSALSEQIYDAKTFAAYVTE